jgi:hypothetical protein
LLNTKILWKKKRQTCLSWGCHPSTGIYPILSVSSVRSVAGYIVDLYVFIWGTWATDCIHYHFTLAAIASSGPSTDIVQWHSPWAKEFVCIFFEKQAMMSCSLSQVEVFQLPLNCRLS